MFDKFQAKRIDGVAYLRLDDALEWALHRALRYDFGRHSSTTGDVAKALIELVPDMSDETLRCMYRDIKNWLEQRDRLIKLNGDSPLGIEIYDHDVKPNIDLKSAVERELRKRGKINSL